MLLRPIQKLSETDPLAITGQEELRDYVDHVSLLTSEEREFYRGKMFAILSGTGRIIAHADQNDWQGLRNAVESGPYKGQPWRVQDAPTAEELTSEEMR